jgi:benzoate 4-monooxygenase
VVVAVQDLLRAVLCKSKEQLVSTSDLYPVQNGQFDLRPWLNMFSFDAFSSMLWSSSYDFLKRGNDSCFSMDAEGNVKTVQAMKAFQTGVHFNTMCAQFSPLLYRCSRWMTRRTYKKQAADHFTGMARYKSVQRLKSEPEGADFFTQFPLEESDKGRTPMSLSDLVAECTTFLNAGKRTTMR